MPKNKNVNVKKLTMSAVMVALSAALSMVKIFEMPLGGSVTLLSMLPVCMLAIMYGCKHGLFCSFVYALSEPFSAGDLHPQRWQAVSHSITS